jgi:hypothetical protein
MNIWNWITSNWQEIVAAIGGIVLGCSHHCQTNPDPGRRFFLGKDC